MIASQTPHRSFLFIQNSKQTDMPNAFLVGSTVLNKAEWDLYIRLTSNHVTINDVVDLHDLEQ